MPRTGRSGRRARLDRAGLRAPATRTRRRATDLRPHAVVSDGVVVHARQCARVRFFIFADRFSIHSFSFLTTDGGVGRDGPCCCMLVPKSRDYARTEIGCNTDPLPEVTIGFYVKCRV